MMAVITLVLAGLGKNAKGGAKLFFYAAALFAGVVAVEATLASPLLMALLIVAGIAFLVYKYQKQKKKEQQRRRRREYEYDDE